MKPTFIKNGIRRISNGGPLASGEFDTSACMCDGLVPWIRFSESAPEFALIEPCDLSHCRKANPPT
jgi:hypothetical protein